MHKLILFFICLSFFACSTEKKHTPQLSKEQQKALDDFKIMDGFEIEMVAAEPLMADPVAMEIDEDGNWFVLEMPGYPLDLSKTGQVRKLMDTNGDGYPDKSEVFVDSLTLPMGIMKWKKGIIIADAPNILYFEDTNGDNKADKKEVILTGFSLSNPQHNMNSPKFGLDNWIYLGHSGSINSFAYEYLFGDKGSDIRYPSNPKAPFLPKNGNGRNVRFKPDSFGLESMSGETQYGHTFDPWGHRFYTDNADHLYHEVLDARYTSTNPNLVIPEAMEKIPDHGDACEIYPISENPNHQLLTDVGVVTSSCGITWYDGGAFGKDFDKVTFVGEPVHNLVHADIIESKGSTFSGKRLLEKKEFLASKDPWFRPVNFYVGPDGALYVIDYYRQLIEHPEWMSEEVNKSGALYNGKTKGRIYRITKKGSNSMNWMNETHVSKESSEKLVELLQSENGWFRKTAQRLLFHRKDLSVVPALQEIVSKKEAEASVPALWLLSDWGKLRPEDLVSALDNPSAGVRENALKIADHLWNSPAYSSNKELTQSLIKTAKDSDARVRFQWLCSSAFFTFPEAVALRSSILNQDIDDHWVGVAAIAASKGSELDLLKGAIKNFGNKPSEGKENFFAYIAAALMKKQDVSFIPLTSDIQVSNDWWQAAMLKGLAQYAEYAEKKISLDENQKNALAHSFLISPDSKMRRAIIAVFKAVGLPTNKAFTQEVYAKFSGSQEAKFQEDALALLSLQKDPAFTAKLVSFICTSGSESVQLASIKALPNQISAKEMAQVNQVYQQMKIPSRKAWIRYQIVNEKYMTPLLKEIANKNIPKTDLEWPQFVELMNSYDASVRKLAREVLAISEDRKAVLQNYLPAAEMAGNPSRGKEIFKSNCTVCHQIKGVSGVSFGPDLSTLKSRNALSIITEIINPNNSIADKYGNWDLQLSDGSRLSGIITSENDNSISLKQMGGAVQTIEKNRIKSRIASKVSAMPNGLDANIKLQDMADLVAFIKGI
ncbi:PVC-type heme-binding CxxCH protein [Aquirufa rosea]|uniref:C-type cytochrome n=1 Tax=Aquirufa rosea TaxID=2509241 RepID=A0A4Q1BZR2_9BACT|nr:PVC-type heme-binding CxxCH protein [Aquirufa rosea]RXK48945.1 c-type cytochrome [Aquirufa rosea]